MHANVNTYACIRLCICFVYMVFFSSTACMYMAVDVFVHRKRFTAPSSFFLHAYVHVVTELKKLVYIPLYRYIAYVPIHLQIYIYVHVFLCVSF